MEAPPSRPSAAAWSFTSLVRVYFGGCSWRPAGRGQTSCDVRRLISAVRRPCAHSCLCHGPEAGKEGGRDLQMGPARLVCRFLSSNTSVLCTSLSVLDCFPAVPNLVFHPHDRHLCLISQVPLGGEGGGVYLHLQVRSYRHLTQLYFLSLDFRFRFLKTPAA